MNQLSISQNASSVPGLDNLKKAEEFELEKEGINSLPRDPLIQVFAKLDLSDLSRVVKVCKRWRHIVDIDECLKKIFENREAQKDQRSKGTCLSKLSWRAQSYFMSLISSSELRFFDSYNKCSEIASADQFPFKGKNEEIEKSLTKFKTPSNYFLRITTAQLSYKADGFWDKIGGMKSATVFWFNFKTNTVVEQKDIVQDGVALGGCFFPKSDLKLIAELYKKKMTTFADITKDNWK